MREENSGGVGEDLRTSAGMIVGLSNGVLTATLAIVAVQIGIVAFVVQQHEGSLRLFALISCLGFILLVASAICGGLGVQRIAARGAIGVWDTFPASQFFMYQTLLTLLGTVVVGLSLVAWIPDDDRQDQLSVSDIRLELDAVKRAVDARLDSIEGDIDEFLRSPASQDDVVKAIEALGRQLQSLPAGGSPWIPYLLLIVVGGVVGGVVIAVRPGPPLVRSMGVGLSIASLFGGGFTLISIDKVPVDFSVQLGDRIAFEQLGEIGPFVTGKRDVFESNALQVGSVSDKCKGRQLRALVVVGSADKFELSTALRMTFGSNAGLARARAEWVAEQLRKVCPSAEGIDVVLTNGPKLHGPTLTRMQTAPDRGVAVYAIRQAASRVTRLSEVLRGITTNEALDQTQDTLSSRGNQR